MTTILLVEVTGRVGGSNTVFRYCMGRSGYATHPSDTPAAYYAGRVLSVQWARWCHGPMRTFGVPSPGNNGGEVTLINADGALDDLLDYAFDGQALRVLQGDGGAAYSTFTVLYQGTMDQPELSLDTLTLRVRDGLQNLDVALQPTKYAGSNVLPAGLEGTDDLKGKPKPILLGWAYNVAPPLVNTSRHIYQLHRTQFVSYAGPGAVAWSLTVYDKRSAVTAGSEKTLAQFGAAATTYAFSVNTATDVFTTAVTGFATGDGVSALSTGGTLPAPLLDSLPYFARVLSPTTFTLHPTQADAFANTNVINITTAGSGTLDISNNRTALGCYDWCNDVNGFYIRLGSAPLGQVTCDAVNPFQASGAYYLGKPSDMVQALVSASRLGVNMSLLEPIYDYSNQAFTSGGVFFDQETTLLKALGEVVEGGGYYLDVRSADPVVGYLTMGRVGYQSSVALTLTEADVLEIERMISQDPDQGIPAWRARLRYKRNYTVMTRDQIAAGVTEAEIAFAGQEWRTEIGTDSATTLNQYPNSPEIERSSAGTDATESRTEAVRVGDQHVLRVDIYRVRVAASKATAQLLAQKVSLTHSRFGLSGGGSLWLLGLRVLYEDQRDVVDLYLW